MSERIQALINQTKVALKTRDIYRKNYEARVASDFVPIDYFQPDEMDISRVLARLLDPRESHAQGTLFLDAFRRLLGKHSESLTLERDKETIAPIADRREMVIPCLSEQTTVNVEYPLLPNKDRLDILLTDRSTKGLIAIENKPWANDGAEQLKRYAQWVERQSEYSSRLVVFLCDREPSEYSIRKDCKLRKQIVRIGFSDLANSLKEAANQAQAPAVRYFVEAFACYLQRNVAREKIMTDQTILDLLSRPENLSAVKEVYDSYPFLLKRAWTTLCRTLEHQCSDKYNGEIIFEYNQNRDQIEKRFIGFSLRPVNPAPVWAVSFECESGYLGDLCWGASLYNADKFPKGCPLRERIRERFCSTCYGSGASSHVWPWWKFGTSDVDTKVNCSLDLPRNLNDPQWLALMLEGLDNILTQAIWQRVESIFPCGRKQEWPDF